MDKYMTAHPQRPERHNHDRRKETRSQWFDDEGNQRYSGTPHTIGMSQQPAVVQNVHRSSVPVNTTNIRLHSDPPQSKTNGHQTTIDYPPPDYSTASDEHTELIQQFLKATNSTDNALAQDILAGTNWRLQEALSAFQTINLSDQPVSTAHYLNDSPMSNSTSNSTTTQSIDSGVRRRPDITHRGLSIALDNVDGEQSKRSSKGSSIFSDGAVSEQGGSKFYVTTPTSTEEKPIIGGVVSASVGSGDKSSKILENRNTFYLPDLSSLEDRLTEYIEYDLIDFVLLNILERTGYINWWAGRSLSRRLWPLKTDGDGNCLLHAASLAMWGYQDKTLMLRQCLHHRLQKETVSGSLYRRWRWQQTQSNKEMSLILSEEEWQAEWDALMKLSSLDPTEGGSHYEFLEEFHVFVLAQILRRPIIVFSDHVLRDVDGYPLSPLPFGGIYLPLLCDTKDCYKSPLLLAYDRSHFVAVVTMAPNKKELKESKSNTELVPLTGSLCDLLPMHFFVDPGKNVDWNNLPEDNCSVTEVFHLLNTYLNVTNIPMEDTKTNSQPLTTKSGSDTSLSSFNKEQQPKQKVKEKKSTSSALKKKLLGQKSSKEQRQTTTTTKPKQEPELEPDQDMIMCAALEILPHKSYQQYMDEYIKKTRAIFHEKKAHGTLKDTAKMPAIATKLSVDTNHTMGSAVPPSLISPMQSGSMLCVACKDYQGSQEHNGLCSSCYKKCQPKPTAELCSRCKEMYSNEGMKGYCSRCYDHLLVGVVNRPTESKPSTTDPRLEAYSIPISNSPDSALVDRERCRSAIQTPGFVEIPVSHHVSHRPASSATSYHTNVGNDIELPYDKGPIAGYLTRDTRHSHHHSPHQGSLSLGLDPSQSSLHMVGSDTRRPSRYDTEYRSTDPRSTASRYPAPQSTASQPRYHRQNSLSMLSGGGTQFCLRCREAKTQCRCYRSQPVRNMHLKSAVLGQCATKGCSRLAATNQGFCEMCVNSILLSKHGSGQKGYNYINY